MIHANFNSGEKKAMDQSKKSLVFNSSGYKLGNQDPMKTIGFRIFQNHAALLTVIYIKLFAFKVEFSTFYSNV